MNKLYALFFLLLPLTLVSQDNAENEWEPTTFKVAILAGFNAAQIDGDTYYGYNKFGLNSAARVQIGLNEHWQPSVEFTYSQRGSRDTETTSDYSLDYVEIPIMINYLDEGLDIGAIEFGVGLSYERLVRSYVEINGVEDVQRSEGFRTNGLSFVAGGTFFVGDHFGINVRYLHSITNILKDSDDGTQVHNILTFRGLYQF